MSKQTEAKAAQGYHEECNRCGNCTHFVSDITTTTFGYTSEKKLRCSLGGFKVKKFGGCSKHVRMEEWSK